MKKYSFALLLVAGIGSLATASTLREHVVADLHKAKPEAVAAFAADLSFALNELEKCPKSVKARFDFGNQIIGVTYADSRNQVRISTITASGSRPAPSFQPYVVTLRVSSKPVKETTPRPEDAPQRRTYSCSVEHAEPPQG